jgi:Bacterial Ig-like domain (group 3)
MKHYRRRMKTFLDETLPEYEERLRTVENKHYLQLNGAPPPRTGLAQVLVTALPAKVRRSEPIEIVVAVRGKGPMPTGDVTLYDNERALDNATKAIIDGGVSWRLTYNYQGVHKFTARYSGDGHYTPQPVSNAVEVNVSDVVMDEVG